MFVKKIGLNEQPYGLGVGTLYVGLLQLPQAIVFVVLGPIAGILAIKYGNLRFIIPGSIVLTIGLFLVHILSFNISRSCKYAYTICCRRIISDLVC